MRGADVDGVLALDLAAVRHNHRLVPLVAAPSWDRYDARRHWAAVRRMRGTVVFVAVLGSEAVGMLGVDVRDARNRRMKIRRWVYLHSLYVAPRVRGHRIARRLVRHALAWARRRGAGGATLEMAAGNRTARALYERFGFVTQEVMMARRLRQSTA